MTNIQVRLCLILVGVYWPSTVTFLKKLWLIKVHHTIKSYRHKVKSWSIALSGAAKVHVHVICCLIFHTSETTVWYLNQYFLLHVVSYTTMTCKQSYEKYTIIFLHFVTLLSSRQFKMTIYEWTNHRVSLYRLFHCSPPFRDSVLIVKLHFCWPQTAQILYTVPHQLWV